MLRIEKGVPIAGIRMKWPFRTMAVGDSFTIPADDGLIQKARQAAGMYVHQNSGVKLTVRKQGDGTARCWRMA